VTSGENIDLHTRSPAVVRTEADEEPMPSHPWGMGGKHVQDCLDHLRSGLLCSMQSVLGTLCLRSPRHRDNIRRIITRCLWSSCCAVNGLCLWGCLLADDLIGSETRYFLVTGRVMTSKTR
jgi:hypothetical protein